MGKGAAMKKRAAVRGRKQEGTPVAMSVAMQQLMLPRARPPARSPPRVALARAVRLEETWTETAGSSENLPITEAHWYAAYAFCIWDGGFLPSEAEWNYAAAGGSDQRAYPWSPAFP